ncbi:ribonuclease T2 [Hyphomicrobium sp. CS1BSMeth3]|jgi:ribonuclease T2|uniref:ribonuclease T2 family protein n=1 Tax=Hyphomicrobium sp. CS1BSMeth3 TaxID=1892844 RepID=UPI0009319382|nr:ribonuclease T2 [Hyphomicrobium sp. CS1BSMeth3]
MILRRIALLALAAALFAPGPAAAQYGTGPGGRAPYERRDQERNVPGRFDYYALVLSWSPTFCASLPRDRYEPQCHRRGGRPYAFVLHGLWPQHERGWPENCPTRQRPFVPQPLVDSMLDIMPSSRLVIHEYRKHGTCSGLTPEGYYGLARRLYNSVTIPQRFVLPNNDFTVSPDAVVRAFVEANPTLRPDMLAVACGGPGNRLREVRICFNRDGGPTRCGRNEEQDRLCRASNMHVPPARGMPAPSSSGRRI